MTDELVGATLGQFRVIAALGEGGMGVVYRAIDEGLDRSVALKVVRAELLGEERYRLRLLREARVAAAIVHPGIATIYQVGEDDGRVFIAMELCEGESLRARLEREGRLALGEAARLVALVCEAVAAAHAIGVVHRDLKPDNVLATRDGRVKVLDFGIARRPLELATTVPESALLQVTREGAIVGTPGYMAPEQLLGEEVDARADVYALGAMLYELCTGKLPFEEATFVKLATRVLHDAPAPPSATVAEIPAALEEVVLRCLAKKRDDRFADAGALAAALAASLQAGATPVRTRTAEAVSLTPRAVARRGAWRRVGWIAGAVGALATAVGVRASHDQPLSDASAGLHQALPRGVRMVDLPEPESANAEALLAYRTGLRAMHAGNWPDARAAFARAVERDEGLAAGWLRVAQTTWYAGQWDASMRAHVADAFARAKLLEEKLSERDRVFLDALEPRIARYPNDDAECIARFGQMLQRFPGDAEVSHELASLYNDTGKYDHALRSATRAVYADPGYADAWQAAARAQWRSGAPSVVVLATLASCEATSSLSLDCLSDRASLLAAEGQCGKALDAARLVAAKQQSDGSGLVMEAHLLASLGEPLLAVRATLERSWTLKPEPRRAAIRLRDLAGLALADGDLGEAARLFGELDALLVANPSWLPRVWSVRPLVVLYREIGRDREAGELAAGYLDALSGMTVAPRLTRQSDAEMVIARALYAAGRIDAARFARVRDEWLAEPHTSPLDPSSRWTLAWAVPAETPAEAREALRALPPGFSLGPVKALSWLGTFSVASDAVGKTYFLAGRTAEALPMLEQAAAECDRLADPVAYEQNALRLGFAYETAGDRTAACRAFSGILSRWAKASASRTLAEARKGSGRTCP